MTDSTDRLDHWLDALGLRAGPDDKPVLGVSACLLGHPVRYDGEHKRNGLVADVLPRWLNMQPLCPETAIGLPTPRAPIQVVQIDAQQRVRGVSEPARDFTDALQQHAENIDINASGFLLKARSPSCGLGNTPLWQAGREIGLTDGAFAAVLVQRFPWLPISNEDQLDSPLEIELFVLRCATARLWQRWRSANRDAFQHRVVSVLPAAHARQLTAFWHRLDAMTTLQP